MVLAILVLMVFKPHLWSPSVTPACRHR